MDGIVKSYLSCANLQVRKSSIHGYGVFAQEDIPSGAIIEECHHLYLESSGDEESVFIDYQFTLFKGGSLLLGYGSIYNHSSQPNATYSFDPIHSLFRFTALRRIKRGEEICTSYGDGYFTSRNIEPVENPSLQQKNKRLAAWRQWLPLTWLLMRFALVMGILTFFTHLISF